MSGEKRRLSPMARPGVDIDAGNRMVELIKPLVRATARAGADAEIGGFGGLFDLARAGFKDPVLVAATDGVGTKVKIAIETDLHDTIGIDLVAMSVNDLVVQGAEPLVLSRLFRLLQARSGDRRDGGRRHRGRLPAFRLRPDRRRDRRNAGSLSARRLRPRRLCGRRRRARHDPAARRCRRRRRRSSAWRRPACIPTAIRWCARSWSDPASPGRDRRRSHPAQSLGEALLTPTRLYVKCCLAAIRTTGAVKALAHITGGGFPDNIPRALPKTLGAHIDLAQVKVAAGVPMAGADRRHRRCMKCCAPSIAESA